MRDVGLFKLIFGNNRGWACVAVIHNIRNPDKSRQGFEQVFYQWPEQLDEIVAWVEKYKDKDCYFCAHLLGEPLRKKELALPGHTLWADLDDCRPEYLGRYGEPRPTVLVQSSPDHWQAYWLLEAEDKKHVRWE